MVAWWSCNLEAFGLSPDCFRKGIPCKTSVKSSPQEQEQLKENNNFYIDEILLTPPKTTVTDRTAESTSSD